MCRVLCTTLSMHEKEALFRGRSSFILLPSPSQRFVVPLGDKLGFSHGGHKRGPPPLLPFPSSLLALKKGSLSLSLASFCYIFLRVIQQAGGRLFQEDDTMSGAQKALAYFLFLAETGAERKTPFLQRFLSVTRSRLTTSSL